MYFSVLFDVVKHEILIYSSLGGKKPARAGVTHRCSMAPGMRDVCPICPAHHIIIFLSY